jgi:2-iminobutanoate/2-iminopropanoate deaminase
VHTARRIHADEAPDNRGINLGTFSQACRVGDTIYIGGTLAIDQERQEVVTDPPAEAFRLAFANLTAIVQSAGAELADVVYLTAMLTDLDTLGELNAVQREFFAEPYPPRSTHGVSGLPHGIVELTAILRPATSPATSTEIGRNS